MDTHIKMLLLSIKSGVFMDGTRKDSHKRMTASRFASGGRRNSNLIYSGKCRSLGIWNAVIL